MSLNLDFSRVGNIIRSNVFFSKINNNNFRNYYYINI